MECPSSISRNSKEKRHTVKISLCKEHYKKLTLMCKTHDSLICHQCSVLHHTLCDVCSLKSIFQSVKPRNLELRHAVNLMESRCETASSEFENEIERALDEIDEAESQIRSMFDSLRKRVQRIGENKLKAMERFKTSVKDLSKRMQVLESFDKADSVSTVHKILNEINTLDRTISEHGKKQRSVKLIVKFKKEFLNILQRKNMDDCLASVVVSKTPVMNQRSTSLEMVKSFRLTETLEDEEPVKPQYTALEYLPHGRIVALDNQNRRFSILGMNLERLVVYELDYAPLDVSVISQTEVAVTSGIDYVIDLLHVEEDNRIVLNRRLKTTSCYDSICLLPRQRLAMATFADRRPVRVITKEGDEKDGIVKLPKKLFQMGGATVAFSWPLDIVVLADRYDNTIQLFNIQNKTVQMITDEHIDGPRGICVAPDGYIYVCCQNTHTLVEISPTGNVVGRHKLKLKFPRALCMTSDGSQLVVSNGIRNSGMIQIYKLT